MKTYAALPLMFEANDGQTDPRVKFLSRGPGYTLFLTDKEAVLSLPSSSPALASANAAQRFQKSPRPQGDKAETPKLAHIVRLKFAGGNTPTAITGRNQLPGKTNYFLGNDPTQWRKNVANYEGVVYRGVYPGVDVVFHGNQQRLEYDFVVAPGADPHAIALDLEGAKRMRITPRGDVVLGVGQSELELEKPVVYQEVEGQRREVAGKFVLRGTSRIGFLLGPFDRALPLVIDPTLTYSTYLGGSNVAGAANDAGTAIAVDSAGDVYVAGTTTSIDFPVTAGAYQSTYPSPGSTAGFVTELNPTGSALIYSTYFGASSGSTNVTAIALDAADDAYLTGYTNSNKFPTTPGAYKTSETASGTYAFATELNAPGTGLVYSTYLSGTEATGAHTTYGFGIAVDAEDNAYVVGTTTSATYPTTAGAFQPVQGCAFPTACGGNGFVTKVSAGGASLSYSTYLGTGSNKPLAVALDSLGDAFVVGSTGASTFPVTPGAFQTSSSDPVPAFVTELNPTGTALVYSTFLSGTNSSIADEALAVAVDASGYAYVTGLVGDSNFPTTAGAYQTKLLDQSDAFVTKLNLTGSALVYSTYLPGHTTGYGIGVNSSGEAYVSGDNYGSAGTFPTTSGAFQASAPTTTTNGFLTVFNSTGSGLVYSTYIGVTSGNEITYAYAVAVDSTGSAYITGSAQPGFPTTPGAYKTTLTANANYPYPVNAFIMKFGFGLSVSPTTLATGTAGVSYGPITFTATGGVGPVTFAVTTGPLPSGLTLSPAGLLSGTPTQTGSFPITITAADSQNDTGSENLTLVINCPTITVGPSTLANGMVGTIYPAVAFSETGGLGSITFSETGLPTGIGMSFAAGVLSGTPTAAESFPITVTATDSNQCFGNIADTLTINSVTLPPAVVTDNETITVTDTETFPDVADSETIKVTDGVTITPLIGVAAPVASFSTSSLGFGTVAAGTTGTQILTVSNVGEGQTGLLLSSAAISPSGPPFSMGTISCSNGASSFPTTLPSGGACLVSISYAAPSSGTPPSATITFTDNAALSNLTSTLSGSSYMQTISLNGGGTTAPQPTEPSATVSVADNETITVTDMETFPDVADSESITVNDTVTVQVLAAAPAPTITSVTPNSGPAAGGETIVIAGQNFQLGATVVFGSTPATLVKVNSVTTISVVVPALIAGTSVTVTNPDGQYATGSFTVQPSISSISPASGRQGQTLNVAITGVGFVNGLTTANFGPHIFVHSLTVEDGAHATANITIESKAHVRQYTVSVTTGTFRASFNGFRVLAAVWNLSPTSGRQGQTVDVAITGDFFQSGLTTANFGPNILVGPVTVTDSADATVTITIAPNARIGHRMMSVTTGTHTENLQFTVEPAVWSLGPTSGLQGQTLDVAITGVGFVSGLTTANFGPNISVGPVTVTDSDDATVTITIAPNARIGHRRMSVTTGTYTENLQFTVEPVDWSLSPTSGLQGQTLDVAITGVGFVSGLTTANFGPNILVGPVTVTDSDDATVTITIAPNAALGARRVQMITGIYTENLQFTVQP